MFVNQAKRLISLGIRATRLNKKQTADEVKKLARAGLVEAKNAARLARLVAREADRERKVITAFLLREYGKEMKKAAPHAKKAAERGKKLVRKAVSVAKKLKNAASRGGSKRKGTKARMKSLRSARGKGRSSRKGRKR